MNLRRLLLLLVLSALLLPACGADDPGETDTMMGDTNTDGGGDVAPDNNPDQTGCMDPGSIQPEGPDADTEFTDCFTGCEHELVPPIFDHEGGDRLRGVIDGNCHSYDIGAGPDVDVVGINAPARTMLEIIIEPADCSAMDPLFTTHSGGFPMTFNYARADGDVAARAVIAAPSVSQSPIYLIIEDEQNYETFASGAFQDCSSFDGGVDYGYLVTVNESPWSPTSLGTLSAGQSLSGSGVLNQGGDIVYFTFMAPADSQPTVTVTRTGSSDFQATVVPMKTAQGEMVWESITFDEDMDGTHVSTGNFRACDADCVGQTAEFAFAVLDWNGVAWPGTFAFDVQVSL